MQVVSLVQELTQQMPPVESLVQEVPCEPTLEEAWLNCPEEDHGSEESPLQENVPVMPRALILETTPILPFESEKANEESGINGADEMPMKTMVPIETEKANESEVNLADEMPLKTILPIESEKAKESEVNLVEEMPEVKKRK